MHTRLVPLMIVALGAACACSSKGEGRPGRGGGDAGAAPAAPVEVVTLARGPIADGIEGSGTVEATRRATVRARVGGVVRALKVEEGDAVEAGAPLAEIERPGFDSLVAQARADLAKAQADLEAAERLSAQGLLPTADRDEAKHAVGRARGALERQKAERGLGAVTAPLAGVVVARQVEPGEAISAGAPLFEVADLSALEVNLPVPERHLARLRVGAPAEITAEGLGETEGRGQVARVAPTVDARTGTVKVTVELGDGAVGEGVRLRPGMFVRARVVLDARPDAVLVPKRAVVYEDDRPFVFVVEDGVARRRALTTGYADREHVEARAGVSAGATVVVFGHRGLEDGAKVQVVAPPAAADAGADGGRAG